MHGHSTSVSYTAAAVKFIIDPRFVVAAVLSTYLYFGIHATFDVTWMSVAAALITAMSLDVLLSYYIRGSLLFPLSALPTALGIGLYFRSAHIGFFVLAAAIAIVSKYIIRKPGGGHIFNPSNFGILVLLFLFPASTTVELTQWGSSYLTYFAVILISLAIAYYADVIVVSISFLSSYLFFLLLLVPYAPDIFTPDHLGLIGPTLVVFGTVMITDPKTVPRGTTHRITHGFVIAALIFLFQYWGVRYELFLATGTTALLNFFFEILYKHAQSRGIRIGPVFLGSFLTACILCIFFFVPFIWRTPAQFSRLDVSPDFVLRGVESGQLVRPNAHAAFVEAEGAQVGSGMYTYGGAWGDYDDDNFDDLFVSSIGGATSKLYRNNGNGTFADVTKQSGLPEMYSSSAYFVDYDGDGKLDLFIAYATSSAGTLPRLAHFMDSFARPVRVYKNTGKRFVEVTDAVGLGNLVFRASDGAGMTFADFNGNGLLSFVIASSGLLRELPGLPENAAYIKMLSDPRFGNVRRLLCDAVDGKIYLAAHDYFGESSQDRKTVDSYLDRGSCLVLYEVINTFPGGGYIPWFARGPLDVLLITPGSVSKFDYSNGAFIETQDLQKPLALARARTTNREFQDGSHPFDFPSGRYFQPMAFDANQDNLPDIVLTADTGSPILFINNGKGVFSEETSTFGLDYAGTTMGVSAGDYTRSGTQSLILTNSREDFLFTKKSGRFEMSNMQISKIGFGWGVSFLDYNLDGWEDVFITNGDATRIAGLPNPDFSRSFLRMDKLYMNDAQGNLVDRTWADLPADAFSGKAVAISDVDNNGSPDIFVGNVSLLNAKQPQRNLLYINTVSGKHYLKVRLRGMSGNSFGIGAKVSVISALGTETKVVAVGGSFYSQNSLRLLFGLGDDQGPVGVRVRWPSGKESVLRQVPIDREIRIVE